MIKHENKNHTEKSSFFDKGPEEPRLCALSGYDDCQTCYFRLSTINRITLDVKQLHKEGI